MLLVTLDTLRGDRWGILGDPSVRTPHLDRTARGGRLSFEGRAPAPLTLPSHVSLMTGLSPAVHGVRDNGVFRLPPDGAPTVAERLRDAGWTTAAFVSSYPLVVRFGLDRGFTVYDDGLGGGDDDETAGHLRERRAGETVDRLTEWLDGDSPPPPATPLFLWTHFFDPHAEYRPPDPWAALSPDPYRAEIGYLDREIGRLLRGLGENRPDRHLRILVTSDHGEALGDGGERTHGVLLGLSVIRVPVVRRDPGYSPSLEAEPVALERVAATLLELAGVDGGLHAAAAPGLDAPPEAIHAETLYPHFNFGWRGLRAREEGGWRLVSGEQDRLYRTVEDPGELRDVAAQYPDIAARMRADLEAEWDSRRAQAATAGAGDSSTNRLGPEGIEALRSLGYASAGAADGRDFDTAFETGPDPRGRAPLVDRINFGVTELGAGRAAEAVGIFEEILAADPANRMAWEYLGSSLLATEQVERARDALRKALDLGPNPTSVYLDLALAERLLGNEEAEWRALERAVAADPRTVPARNRMAKLLMDRGRVMEAKPILEAVARLRPRSPRPHVHLGRIERRLGNVDEARRHWRLVGELGAGTPYEDIAEQALERIDREEGKPGEDGS